MEREKVVGNIFNFIFGFWCIFDIVLRTPIEDKINAFLTNALYIPNADIDRYIDTFVLVYLLVIIAFLQRYSQKELFLLVVISIPIIISTINSNNNYLISMLLFIVGSKYADMEKIIGMYFRVLIISIPMIIILCLAGFLPDFTMLRNGQIRHALGFEHPNRLGMRLFQLMACMCYVDKGNNHRLLKYICMGGSAWFVYKVPNSQTAYIGIFMLVVLIGIGHLYDRYGISKKRLMYIMALVAAFTNIFSILASVFYSGENRLLHNIDRFLSHRFSYGHRMYKYYGITVLGQNVQTVVKDNRYVGVYRTLYLDNAYFSILLRFGIIVYIIITILWLAAILYQIECDDYVMVSILFSYSIYGIMTTGFYMLSHNVFLLTMAYPIYQKKMTINQKSQKIKFVWKSYGRLAT